MLNEIFDVLDAVTTPKGCYELHKRWREKQKLALDVVIHFIDEVIFWEDRNLYKFCVDSIDEQCSILRKALKKYPKSDKFAKEYEHLQFLKGVIISGDRTVHTKMLENQTRKTIYLLKKHVGIEGRTGDGSLS